MQASIEARLRALPAELEPLALHAGRYLQSGCVERSDGTLLIGPAPWIGTEAFCFVIYPPPNMTWLVAFQRRWGPVPPSYSAVLTAMNGCVAFGLTLYGLAPSLQADPPLLDRRTLQPLDLTLANGDWAREYMGADGQFHIGARHWTYEEDVGYFVGATAEIQSRRKAGEVMRSWRSLRELLADELSAAEDFDREHRPVRE